MFNILLADTPTPPEWVLLGKLGLVVGILAGVVTIIAGVVTVVWFLCTILPAWLKPLKVEFRFLTFPSTRVLEDAFEFLGSKNTLEEIMLRIPFDLLATREKHLELKAILAKAITDRFADKLPHTTWGGSRAITVLKIKNTGRKIQKNVTLFIAQADYFLIKKNNTWEPQIAPAGEISLGDMQAHDEIEVCAWGSDPWNQSRRWLKVRSNEGPAVIKYRPWKTEWRSFIPLSILYGVAFGCQIVALSILVWRVIQQWWPH